MSDEPHRVVLASRPEGSVKPDDFRLERMPMPDARPGGLLLRTLVLSLDPYMRGRMDDRASYAKPVAVGETMEGEALAEVVRSHDPAFQVGEVVRARTGWRTHAAASSGDVRRVAVGGAPMTTALGVLGMPGFTAYAGLTILGRPRAGETVVVAAASGPVGSLVGLLAKRAGARAVGIAGGPEKCGYVTDELGFDAAVDHRDPEMARRLAEACPDGVDVYFENVGGAIWQAVIPLLNRFARVPVCGLISQYDGAAGTGPDDLRTTMRAILTKSLSLRGFINYEFEAEHFGTFVDAVAPGVADGSIRYREDVVDGLENAPGAFIGMLAGRNFGKALVRVARPDRSHDRA